MLGAVRFAPSPEAAACSKRSRLSLAEYLGRDCRHDSTCKYMPLHISTLARSVSEIDVGLKRRIAQRFQKYAQPVGGVIAYEKQISISGVGFDIGCGNMAIRLDTPFNAVEGRSGRIIKGVARTISFGVGRTNEEQVDHELFDDAEAWAASEMESYRQKAAAQLGTVGSGNHYVDLLRDEDGFVWIGVHFGSRGLGHTSATRYPKGAGGKGGSNAPPALIDEDSELGRRYIAAMELAGRYAYAGREWVVERVRPIVGGAVTDTVHNHHNYAWRET